MVANGPVLGRKAGSLAGRHAVRRTPGHIRYLVPLAAAVLVAAVLVGVSVTTGGLGGLLGNDRSTVADLPASSQPWPGETSASPSASGATAIPSVGPSATSASPSPVVSATPRRASRGEARSPKPSPSASRTPTSSTVVSSGTCGASYYATGSKTASGEPFDPDGLTAAHKTLPFDTRVRVTNTANGKSVVVRINDRGPFVSGRCLDLARGAFTEIASLSAGVITAKYEVLKS